MSVYVCQEGRDINTSLKLQLQLFAQEFGQTISDTLTPPVQNAASHQHGINPPYLCYNNGNGLLI